MALEFTINLKGDFNGALQKSNKELGDTEKKTKNAEKAMSLFEGELGKVQAGALALNFSSLQKGGSFFKFDLAEGARMAYDAISEVVGKVIDLGAEMIKVAGATEDLNLAVKLDVGEGAEKKIDQLTESFKSSAFDPQQLKEGLLPILEQSGTGHQDQWNDLITAATDIATRQHTGIAGAKQALLALNDIDLNPQRITFTLRNLGIRQLDYFKDLGNLLGISQDAARKQLAAGKIKAQTLMSVALHQIAEREGGALGNATNEGSKTLGASLARLSNLKEVLFEKLAGTKGMQAVQSALDNIVTTMEGPLGTQLLARADHAFEEVAGWIQQITSPEGVGKIERGFSKVIGVVEELPNILDKVVTASEVLATIWAGGKIVGAVTSLTAALPALATAAGATAASVSALATPLAAVVAAGAALGAGAAAGLHYLKHHRSAEQIHHDALVGDAYWKLSAAQRSKISYGDALADPDFLSKVPQMASGGLVSSPTLALIGESGPEAVVPLGRSFGTAAGVSAGSFSAPSITYAPQFSFTGASGDVQDQIESFEQQHRVELKRFIDEVRAAAGG